MALLRRLKTRILFALGRPAEVAPVLMSSMPVTDLFDRPRQRRHQTVGRRTAETFFRLAQILRKSPDAGKKFNVRKLHANALAQRAGLSKSERRKRRHADHILRFRREVGQYFFERRIERQRENAMTRTLQPLRQHRAGNLVGPIVGCQTENANRRWGRLRMDRGQLRLLRHPPPRNQPLRFCSTFLRPINRQLRNDFAYAEIEERLPRLVQRSLVPVLFGQRKRGNENLVIQAHQWVRLQKSMRDRSRVFLIERQQPLIELRLDREGSFISQQDMKKRHTRHITSQYNHANRQRNRQHQPRPPPKYRPENGRDQQCKQRNARVRAV